MHWYIDPIKDHYVDFDGRAMREPFWLFVLINMVVSYAVSYVGEMTSFKHLSDLYGIAILLPALSLTARRLHDTGRSGWWQLLLLIPIIGWIILLVFLVQDTELQDNQYGQNPKAVDAPVANTQEASNDTPTV